MTGKACNMRFVPQWKSFFIAGCGALFVSAAQAQTPIPIGQAQGVIGPEEQATAHDSPIPKENETTIQGVVYEKTLQLGGRNPLHGFFMQNTSVQADKDPNTSDGIFVFIGGRTEIGRGPDAYLPMVGDEIVLKGRIEEYKGVTQLSKPVLVSKLCAGVDLEKELPAIELAPPADKAEADRYYERLEGMRVRVPSGCVTTAPRSGFDEIYLTPATSSFGKRTEPYTNRLFRDTHPLDNIPDQLFDDGNGEMIVIGNQGLAAAAPGAEAPLLPPVRTFSTLTAPATGGLSYSFGKYIVYVADAPPVFKPGVDPALNHPLPAPDLTKQLSIGCYNVENLYDFRDDPSDPNDFTGNPGAYGIKPPFNYVPKDEAVYRHRLSEQAQQMVAELHAPDVLLIQEAEDQDMGGIVNGAFAVGAPDGKPDTLQELTLAIAAAGGPAYDAVFDRDGADHRGIICAFLYRTDRVRLLDPAKDPILGTNPSLDYTGQAAPYNADVSNPKALNALAPSGVEADDEGGSFVHSRAPQLAGFEIFPAKAGEGTGVRIYLINNHQSSRPNERVAVRKEQANFSASVVKAILATDPQALVMNAGDMNVFPRPDDPFRPGDKAFPSDQLKGLYDAGLYNVFDHLVEVAPASAYSYVYNGTVQTLDQMFLTPALKQRLASAAEVHINSDFPSDHTEDGARGASDHDPMVARFTF